MKVLVTGGSGFIGTNMIDFLLEKQIEVINLDWKEPKIEEHRDVWKNIDILNKSSVFEIFNRFQPQAIIHLAARTDLNGSNLKDYQQNTIGTQNIIEVANEFLSVERIIFTSSMLVCKAGYEPKNESDFCPTTIYGESKVNMEKIIRNTEIKAEWAIIRPTSIWGPWFGEPYRNFFDIVLSGIFVHPGNKACTKTYGFVGNSINQIYTLMTCNQKNVNKKYFYIGDDPAIQISDWADEIRIKYNGKTNKKLPYFMFLIIGFCGDLLKVVGIKFPMTSFRLRNMTTNNIVNLDHLYKVIGKNSYSRNQGIDLTLAWLKKNK